jgi:serine/threonine protein kinase
MSTRVPHEKAVFCEALEITDPEQRRQFLDQACGADKALRAQVERLLALSQSAGDFFKDCAPALEPAAADADQVLSAAESALEPEIPETKCIGPYKLLQKLGEGGYGVVYMVEQEQPIRRRVALKIIKLGMDTKNVIARFEAERQALALMDHTNIARVLDAGATETGLTIATERSKTVPMRLVLQSNAPAIGAQDSASSRKLVNFQTFNRL